MGYRMLVLLKKMW